ncbi:MAG: hypothetical protein H7A20_11070 [Rhodanobacteraceae bacterium]|nr:hypothetical protein [Xanthomonadales bacterium]MCP5479298.1 hypothetical protein [Rhodanobacteraceae bacterium]HPF74568.1 hypothetical protein [Xanthomonadaceae bacterium]HRX98879.1 hypothetical protein [Xanthomonadaceae bacterium]
MSDLQSHLQIALASIEVFNNDGRLDLAELDRLLGIALKDRVVDDEERRVLARIFREAEAAGVDATVARRIAEARQQHAIPD